MIVINAQKNQPVRRQLEPGINAPGGCGLMGF
jgi:hypothetical protein